MSPTWGGSGGEASYILAGGGAGVVGGTNGGGGGAHRRQAGEGVATHLLVALVSLEFFDMGPVYAATDVQPSSVQAYAEDMIRNQIDPESWDADPSVSLMWWRDMLLVRQTPAVHGRIRSLLEALERALRR